MMFFLSKVVLWWFAAAVVAAIFAAALCHYWPARRNKPVVDERHVRALADARATAGRHEAKVNELLAVRAKEREELTTLRAKLDSVDAMSRRIKQLENERREVAGRTAELVELEETAARVAPLTAQVAELESRLQELAADAAETDALRARVAELEAVAPVATDDGGDAPGEVAVLRERLAALESSTAQVAALQSRVTELEADAAELATLRSHLNDAEQALDEARGRATALEQGADEAREARAARAQLEARLRLAATDAAEVETLRARVAEVEAELAAAREAATRAPADGGARTLLTVELGDNVVDVSGAYAVLRTRIKPNDLKVVEGIGPKIAELLGARGITSWRALAATEPSVLRRVLEEAGPRFQMHDPTTWPRQAALLADADWSGFKALADELKGGRTTKVGPAANGEG